MAGTTAEDAAGATNNHFDLVLIVARRARQLQVSKLDLLFLHSK